MPARVSLRWSLSSLSHAEGLRDGTHPLAARTCEPWPLTQARQIRPAAPVGALKRGPADRSCRKTTHAGVSRIAGQAGPVPDPTPEPGRTLGSRAGSTIHILPAEYSRAAIALGGSFAESR